MAAKKALFVYFIIVCAFIFCANPVFACNANQKGLPATSKITTGRVNNDNIDTSNDILNNTNTLYQLMCYRTAKSSPFIKIFFTSLVCLYIALKYLKYNLRNIFGGYARFLKLLLYPNHVFW